MSHKNFSRRDFLRLSAISAGAMVLPPSLSVLDRFSAHNLLQSDTVTFQPQLPDWKYCCNVQA